MVETPPAAGANIPPLLCTVLSGITLLASASYAGMDGLPILSPPIVLFVCALIIL